MKVAGIICEYNPFHNGHKYQLDKVRAICGEDTYIIALMSGNYVQRGDVAIYEKNLRAKVAITGGADLVLELPPFFATQSAEFFSYGAVSILNALNLVDILAFGAESDNPELIEETATLLCNEAPEFSKKLSALCDSGLSFPTARAKAVGEILGKEASVLLNEPNNILAVEYCKAILSLSSPMKPLLIKRTGAMHHATEVNNSIASATHIRTLLTDGKKEEAFSLMPETNREFFSENAEIHSIKAMEKSILAEILKMPVKKLQTVSDVNEGLENRIKEKTLTATSLEELADSVKTKRYTHSRIRRILLSAYLGITDSDRKSKPRYIRILAHNERGQELIRKAKKSSALPLVRNTSQVNKLNDPVAKEMWERERVFDLIYSLFRI